MPESTLLRRLLLALSLLVGLLLEGYFAWWMWFSGLASAPWTLVLVALGGALFTALGLARVGTANPWLNFWLYAGLALFVPAYGALGALGIALYLWRGRSGSLVQQYADYIDAEEGEGERQDAFLDGETVDQMVQQELNVQSYLDIVRGSDRILKKALISKILSEWTPNAVGLLKEALKDPEYEIRSYASTGLTAIENRTNARILELKQTLQERPEDLSAQLGLAQNYLAYAESGLLDGNSSTHYVSTARDLLEKVEQIADEAQNLQWLNLRGQAARLLGDTAAERRIYEEILATHPDHQETLSRLCEVHFRGRDFGALRRTCDAFLTHTRGEHPALAAARLWVPSGVGR